MLVTLLIPLKRPRVPNRADLDSSLGSALSGHVAWADHLTLSLHVLMYKMGVMLITPWACLEECMR